jgi:hypothetical protein
MSEPKFTPGPWKVRLYNHYIGRNYTTRRTHKVENKSGLQVVCTVTSGVYAQGNLDLIAAAPDMYAELERIEDVLEDSEDCGEISLDRIKSILRKARGESEVEE